MAAAMASLLKTSCFCNYRNQTINRRIIIITPGISFPVNRKTPLPKITTATTTKCSNRGSSTFREEPFLFEILKEALMRVVKELEKPALTAVLVWILLTNNPIIASPFSRTAIFWKVWFVYDVCKAIASKRRNDDDGTFEISLGPVLFGSMMIIPIVFEALFMFGKTVVAAVIGK